MGALPEIRSYAPESNGAGSYAKFPPGTFYIRIPEGVSTLTVGSQSGSANVYLTTERNTTSRYVTAKVGAGRSLVLSNIGVPSGAERYLSIQVVENGDLGVTLITYPL